MWSLRCQHRLFLTSVPLTSSVCLLSLLTLCNPMDCSPPRLLCPRDFPGKNIRVGCHLLLQGIFLTQGSNPSSLHCRSVLYHLATRKAPIQSIQFSHSLMSNSLQPHRLQHTRLPCPSPTPRVCSNSHPSHQ